MEATVSGWFHPRGNGRNDPIVIFKGNFHGRNHSKVWFKNLYHLFAVCLLGTIIQICSESRSFHKNFIGPADICWKKHLLRHSIKRNSVKASTPTVSTFYRPLVLYPFEERVGLKSKALRKGAQFWWLHWKKNNLHITFMVYWGCPPPRNGGKVICFKSGIPRAQKCSTFGDECSLGGSNIPSFTVKNRRSLTCFPEKKVIYIISKSHQCSGAFCY